MRTLTILTLLASHADVPLVLSGAGVMPGTYDTDASPLDIAPTMARLAAAELPSAPGRVLEEALAAPATR